SRPISTPRGQRRAVRLRLRAVRTSGPREAGRPNPPERTAAAVRRVQGGAAAARAPAIVGSGDGGRPRTGAGARVLHLPRSGVRAEGARKTPDRARFERARPRAAARSAARLVRLTVSVRAD